MIYINLDEIELPPGWNESAKKAFDLVKELPPDQRIKIINKKSKIWQKIKPKLEIIKNHKCWYCESINHRADNNVDHFRPKGSIVECRNHNGYWWLAFDWRNYRFSCTYCNSRRGGTINGKSGGKHDHFPLLNAKQRAQNPYDDINIEQPYLLDPAKKADPGLLWFDQDGQVVPRYTKTKYLRLYKRAKVSIRLYNLNYSKTVERRMILYNEVAQLVGEGDKYFERYARGDQDMEYAFTCVVQRLGFKLEGSSEFSAAAKSYLLGLRSERRPWLDALFTT